MVAIAFLVSKDSSGLPRRFASFGISGESGANASSANYKDGLDLLLNEDAHIIIASDNKMAIALQKASTFTCNDLELRGKYQLCLLATSGSMFVGRFKSDVGRVEATTGANINIEQIDGKWLGPAVARHAARISLPDRDVLPE